MSKQFSIFNFQFSINGGFTLMEVIISIGIFSIILFAVISSFLSVNNSNYKTIANREASENAQRVLEKIIYEIRSAKSIYSPTTTQNQLSLETLKYLPAGQENTYIDFFLCGSAVCFKKEDNNAVSLTSSAVQVTNLTFSQILTSSIPSIQVGLTVNYPGTQGSLINLTSTASLRSY